MRDGRIDPVALSSLASALNIPQGANLIVETQKRWLRKPYQERWEMAELSAEQKLFVLNWSREQGLFSPWKPISKRYDKALILGATTSRMQIRLDYLKQLWNEGTRFSEIVWLTGNRPLDKRIDGLTDRCSDESEAAHILWEETDLPEAIRSLPVVFVTVPMKTEGGSLKRPNTEDTLVAWLKTAPEPCKILFISNQPFCGYQFAVIRGTLPDTFLFDLAGGGSDSMDEFVAPAAIILDTIARWIYQDDLIPCAKKIQK